MISFIYAKQDGKIFYTVAEDLKWSIDNGSTQYKFFSSTL